MSQQMPVRIVDKFSWIRNSLILTASDKEIGLQMQIDSYFVKTAFIQPRSEALKDYKLNLDNTEFEVNTFLAEMISQPKG